ncbi:GTP-binding protein [Candidatus Vidania fulgoroideorum]
MNGIIVGIFGDVDNGKTTLLSKIFNKKIYEKERITQKIRTMKLFYENIHVVFIDTPGHESFFITVEKIIKMSDINIIIIDVLKGISKNLLKILEKIPKSLSIFLINKIDRLKKYEVNNLTSKIKTEIEKIGFLLEENGGENFIFKISAVKNKGINCILKQIKFLSSILTEKKNYGYVFSSSESNYMKFSNKLLIKNGTLKLNNYIYTNKEKIRIDNILVNKKKTKQIGCFVFFRYLSKKPLEIGQKFYLYKKKVTNIVIDKEISFPDNIKTFLVKTDCYVKLYAIKEIYRNFRKIRIIFLGIGKITPSEIKYAEFLKTKILYFSEKYRISNNYVLLFSNIYKFKDYIYNYKEFKSKAEVLKIFRNRKKTFYGCKIIKGLFSKDSKVNIVIKKKTYFSKIKSLMIDKNKVSSVNKGTICGMLFNNFNIYENEKIVIYKN